MIPASPTEQRTLLELQQVDSAIRQLEHRRANLPEQQALDEKVDMYQKVSQELARARQELERLEGQQRRYEEEITQVDARRKAEEGRMYSGAITSEREADAIRSELSALRSRKHELEDKLLEVMERVEALTSLQQALEARESELAGGMAALTAARDEAAKDIDARSRELSTDRRRIAEALDGDLVEYYDELRARKSGLAVAELRGRTCAGCNLDLTPIELEETRAEAAKRFPKCPQCDRLLVVG